MKLPRLRRLPELARALVLRAGNELLGLPWSLPSEDRRLLERVILPFFAARADCRRVLFVGCDWYTRAYERLFAGREYWTLEKDPARGRYGAGRHVADALANLAAHFAPDSLDLIVVNGVLGWGLDDAAEAEDSLAACAGCLGAGGVLLLGWNDVPEKRVLIPSRSRGLAGLSPWSFPPLGTHEHATGTANRHTFSFFVKPAAA